MPIKKYGLLKLLHMDYVFNRRVERLAAVLSDLIPDDTSVLDIGCGNGYISSLLLRNKKGMRIRGLELKARDECLIPCLEFDGEHIPFKDGAYDFCLIVDVLHHANDSRKLLKEAARVCRKGVVIKDHLCENIFDFTVLKIMDWVGNRPYGIVLPYNFLSRKEWQSSFAYANLKSIKHIETLSLYPFWADFIFGRSLHFVSLLEKKTMV